jgi:serine/tyrosine/threonine adenylyltransferase
MRQASTCAANLARLAETLLPLLAKDEAKALAAAEESLGSFAAVFHAAYLGLRRKIGLAAEADADG